MARLQDACARAAGPHRQLLSRAYHDALFMAQLAPLAMVFVRSHVDVKSVASARDLVTDELGELSIRSARPGMGVKLEGKAVSRKLPFNAKLPAGEYEIRIVEPGKRVSERRVRVKPGAITELELPQ